MDQVSTGASARLSRFASRGAGRPQRGHWKEVIRKTHISFFLFHNIISSPGGLLNLPRAWKPHSLWIPSVQSLDPPLQSAKSMSSMNMTR